MKRSRLIAALSAAVLAVSMTAVPAQALTASDNASGAVVMGKADYTTLDVVNAFEDAGVLKLNIINLKNFLILNKEYFDSSDYAEFIDFANEIRDLYISPVAYSLFFKTPAELTTSERYDVYDALSKAEKDAIIKSLVDMAEDHYILVTFDEDANGYPLAYGSMRQNAPKAGNDSKSGKDSSSTKKGTKKISNAKITLSSTKLIYNGSARKPGVTVKLGGKTLTKGKDYSLSFSNNVKPGKATVTVKGKGNYSGSQTVTFYIAPRKVTLNKVTSPAKYKIKAVWTRESKATGYNIQVATNSDFYNPKKFYTKSNSTTTKTISGLSSGRKYFVRVRAYKQVGSRKVCGKFSAVKKITVK